MMIRHCSVCHKTGHDARRHHRRNPTGAGYSSGGTFHPNRSWAGYSAERAGEKKKERKKTIDRLGTTFDQRQETRWRQKDETAKVVTHFRTQAKRERAALQALWSAFNRHSQRDKKILYPGHLRKVDAQKAKIAASEKKLQTAIQHHERAYREYVDLTGR